MKPILISALRNDPGIYDRRIYFHIGVLDFQMIPVVKDWSSNSTTEVSEENAIIIVVLQLEQDGTVFQFQLIMERKDWENVV